MIRRPTAPLLLALALGFVITGAVHAAVFTPTKTADSTDGACDADCSLREAVIAANAHAGEDVILLHRGVYQLAIAGDDDSAPAGALDVPGALPILGGDAEPTTIDG